jgi:hypothetical protein
MVDNLRGTNMALVSWVTAVIMFFAIAIKLGTRMMVTKSFGISLDGALVLAAMVLCFPMFYYVLSYDSKLANANIYVKASALGQTGAITYAVKSGLGMHLAALTASRVASYQQVWIQYILSYPISG